MLLFKHYNFILLLFYIIFLVELETADVPVDDIVVRAGTNVTLACQNKKHVKWVKEDRSQQFSKWQIASDGSLHLNHVERADSGFYICILNEDTVSTDDTILARDLLIDDSQIQSQYRLNVQTVPGPLANVSVYPSTVLALLMWDVGDTGGCPITSFTAQFRLKQFGEVWHNITPRKMSHTTRQVDVYHLSPNATYVFRVWAHNEIGPGTPVEVDGTTKHVDQEIELAKHFLEGAENFDTRIWVVAVAVVMGTLLVLSAATGYLLCKDCRTPTPVWHEDDQEVLELVPNIILNPGFLEDTSDVRTTVINNIADENGNHRPRVLINNNSIIRPAQGVRV